MYFHLTRGGGFRRRKSILRCPRFILNERPPAGPPCLISNEIVLHETEAPTMGKSTYSTV